MSARSEKRKAAKKLRKEKREERRKSYTALDKQHIVYIAIMAVLSVILLAWSVPAYMGEAEEGTTKAPETSTTVQSTTQPTTAPSTTAPSVDSSTTKPSEQAKPDEPTKDSGKEETDKGESKEEILKKVSDGINALKAPDASYIGKKNQYIDIKLTDCSVPQVMGLINGVLERFMGEEKFDYDFVNGVADDPDEGGQITTDKAIPPSLKPFALTIDGVEDAWVEKDGENTVYTITVVPEESTMDQKPKHHDVACDVIALESLNIPAKITKADYKYSGTKISVTYNPQGQVVRYHEYFDMYGVGEGGAMGVTATCVMEGYIDETWDIEWK